ncbi:MAG: hypothetical protein V1772_05295 [Chloroflexota bacterium]
MISEVVLVLSATLSGIAAMALRREGHARIAFGAHSLIMAGVAQRIAGGWVAALWGLVGAALLLHGLVAAPKGDQPAAARPLGVRVRVRLWVAVLGALLWVALVMPLAVNYWPGEAYATPASGWAPASASVLLAAAWGEHALALLAVALTLAVAASVLGPRRRP